MPPGTQQGTSLINDRSELAADAVAASQEADQLDSTVLEPPPRRGVDAYVKHRLSLSEGSGKVGGGSRKRGRRYTDGPYKGMTPSQAEQAAVAEYEQMVGDGDPATEQWENRANSLTTTTGRERDAYAAHRDQRMRLLQGGAGAISNFSPSTAVTKPKSRAQRQAERLAAGFHTEMPYYDDPASEEWRRSGRPMDNKPLARGLHGASNPVASPNVPRGTSPQSGGSTAAVKGASGTQGAKTSGASGLSYLRSPEQVQARIEQGQSLLNAGKHIDEADLSDEDRQALAANATPGVREMDLGKTSVRPGYRGKINGAPTEVARGDMTQEQFDAGMAKVDADMAKMKKSQGLAETFGGKAGDYYAASGLGDADQLAALEQPRTPTKPAPDHSGMHESIARMEDLQRKEAQSEQNWQKIAASQISPPKPKARSEAENLTAIKHHSENADYIANLTFKPEISPGPTVGELVGAKEGQPVRNAGRTLLTAAKWHPAIRKADGSEEGRLSPLGGLLARRGKPKETEPLIAAAK